MKIKTEYQRLRFTNERRFDWNAVDDDTYDGPPSPIGWGATEHEAIADLLTQIEEREDTAPVSLGTNCYTPGEN